jgi:hypothetical protein
MNHGEKRGSPRLDHHQQAIAPEHARTFSKGSIQVIREHRQVMQAALDDKNILAVILKWELAAIPDQYLTGAGVLSGQGRG